MRSDVLAGSSKNAGLVDVLDRVLDKGLVIAGDIKVSLAEVELLTIRVRLIVCSLDKAEQIGLDWWRYDRYLSPGRAEENNRAAALTAQVKMLEDKLARLEAASAPRRRATAAKSVKSVSRVTKSRR